MLHSLLEPFQACAFSVSGAPTTWGELLGVATGVWCLVLLVRQHVANWPVGLANNAFFFLLFADVGLYADAGLQLAFAAFAIYGWRVWLRGGTRRTPLAVTRVTRRQWAVLAAMGIVGTVALTALLDRATASTVPAPDAFTTVLSLLATWGQARKKLESWWLWIAADVVYVPLYLVKGLALTAGLYVLFGCLCVAGLRSWRRALPVACADMEAQIPLRIAT